MRTLAIIIDFSLLLRQSIFRRWKEAYLSIDIATDALTSLLIIFNLLIVYFGKCRSQVSHEKHSSVSPVLMSYSKAIVSRKW